MSNQKLENEDKSLLDYRPEIRWVEPTIEGNIPEGKKPLGDTQEQVNKDLDLLVKSAKAYQLLAEVFQAKVDERVKDFYIKLDPKVDRSVIDAMRRKYGNRFKGGNTIIDFTGKTQAEIEGNFDPTKITFAQYKECREALKDRGNAMAQDFTLNKDEMKQIRADPLQPIEFGIMTPEGKHGLLKPESNKPSNFPEFDPDSFMEKALKMLANLLWKKFIGPLRKIPGAGLILPEDCPGCKVNW